MFTVDDLATIYIYSQYIIPIIILFAIVGYVIITHYSIKFKIYHINRKHDVEKIHSATYWYTYKCRKCGKVLYKQPSSVNTSLSSSDYIFRYTGKCE